MMRLARQTASLSGACGSARPLTTRPRRCYHGQLITSKTRLSVDVVLKQLYSRAPHSFTAASPKKYVHSTLEHISFVRLACRNCVTAHLQFGRPPRLGNGAIRVYGHRKAHRDARLSSSNDARSGSVRRRRDDCSWLVRLHEDRRLTLQSVADSRRWPVRRGDTSEAAFPRLVAQFARAVREVVQLKSKRVVSRSLYAVAASRSRNIA